MVKRWSLRRRKWLVSRGRTLWARARFTVKPRMKRIYRGEARKYWGRAGYVQKRINIQRRKFEAEMKLIREKPIITRKFWKVKFTGSVSYIQDTPHDFNLDFDGEAIVAGDNLAQAEYNLKLEIAEQIRTDERYSWTVRVGKIRAHIDAMEETGDKFMMGLRVRKIERL